MGVILLRRLTVSAISEVARPLLRLLGGPAPAGGGVADAFPVSSPFGYSGPAWSTLGVPLESRRPNMVAPIGGRRVSCRAFVRKENLVPPFCHYIRFSALPNSRYAAIAGSALDLDHAIRLTPIPFGRGRGRRLVWFFLFCWFCLSAGSSGRSPSYGCSAGFCLCVCLPSSFW